MKLKWHKKFWTESGGSFILAVLIALTVRWALMEAYVIPSGSMMPTLLIQDHIFVNKLVYGLRLPFTEKWMLKFSEPQRGEVVVFKYPSHEKLFYIKRVIGVSGDRVYYENGNLYVNDKLVEKSVPRGKDQDQDIEWLRDQDFEGEGPGAKDFYVYWQEKLDEVIYSILQRKGRGKVESGPYTVPEGHFFVMGDNRDNSQDSRKWSENKRFIPRENLVGRAMFVWLSCEKTLPVVSFLCNPASVRWSRFFHSVE